MMRNWQIGVLARLLVVGCCVAPLVNAQWTGYHAPGVPRTADGKVNLTAPVPKAFDGHPDLGGTWESEYGYFADLGKDLKPGDIVMTQWAKDLQAQRESSEHNADRMTQCMPPGVPRMNLSTSIDMVHPFKIVQAPSLVMLLYETSANSTFRQVFMDGRPLPKNANLTWLGYSVGHWEGNTLVVETTGFNGEAWVDTVKGHPQSDQGRVIERFTRRDYGHLDMVITIDDPKAYVKPWTAKVPAHLLPDSDLLETYCENEKDSPHMSLGGVH
jgi:hypothetical protein